MPKSLVLGNGNILVTLDNKAQVKDFYFPYVGLENQAGAHFVHRIGIWVDNQISWFLDDDWSIYVNYQEETQASEIKALNSRLQIRVDLNDVVYNEKNLFIRKAEIHNLADHEREIKIYFHQEFELYESHRGDTAYYDPNKKVIIHYKGRRVFLVNAISDNQGFDDYSVGLFRIEGKDGTYRDAEDGKLEKNSIEHGLVDSIIGITNTIKPNSSATVYYWLAAAKFIKEAHEMNQYLLEKTPPYVMKTTHDFWHAWVNKQPFHFKLLDESVVRLFKKSLLITRTHVDNRGAILASGDSDILHHGRDTYSYMWPRDGALIAMALDKAGDANVVKKFLEFCNSVVEDQGFFMHRYRADQSLGSSWHPWIRDGKPELPIQEDETALILIALWNHYNLSKDLEFVEDVYNSLIKKCAEFLVEHREPNGLPKPSYDLWEEKFGISTYTASAVFAALIAASRFARLLGKAEREQKYTQAAKEIKEAILKYLYDEQAGYFYKLINFENDQQVIDKTVDVSSALAIMKFGVLSIDDPRLQSAFKITEEKLTIQTGVGGVVRYEGDKYFTVDTNLNGNPWIICTLWLAQYYIARVKTEADLEKPREYLSWAVKYALPSGILPEQLNPYTGEHISASPLIWSHAEFIVTVIKYLEKLEDLGICMVCNPVK